MPADGRKRAHEKDMPLMRRQQLPVPKSKERRGRERRGGRNEVPLQGLRARMEGEGETAGLNEVTQTVVDSPWHGRRRGSQCDRSWVAKVPVILISPYRKWFLKRTNGCLNRRPRDFGCCKPRVIDGRPCPVAHAHDVNRTTLPSVGTHALDNSRKGRADVALAESNPRGIKRDAFGGCSDLCLAGRIRGTSDRAGGRVGQSAYGGSVRPDARG